MYDLRWQFTVKPVHNRPPLDATQSVSYTHVVCIYRFNNRENIPLEIRKIWSLHRVNYTIYSCIRFGVTPKRRTSVERGNSPFKFYLLLTICTFHRYHALYSNTTAIIMYMLCGLSIYHSLTECVVNCW